MNPALQDRFEDRGGAEANRNPGPIATFADLFCGIGGFHLAAAALGLKCVYACDTDNAARDAYEANFGIRPDGDIRRARPLDLPRFDLLCAGFPCQPFSIIGDRKGMSDPRGALFFEIVRIAKAKRPAAIVLENVKQLVTLRAGQVVRRIAGDLQALGYHVDYRVLNALDFGLPQKRERVLIVATRKPFDDFPWPTGKTPMEPLAKVLEKKPDARHFASDKVRRARRAAHKSSCRPGVWHENKGGNVSSHPFSCALRAGASHNYLLVNGERRLTPREMLRLQGFPEQFKIVCADSQTRKQAGNAVPVPLARAALSGVVQICARTDTEGRRKTA